MKKVFGCLFALIAGGVFVLWILTMMSADVRPAAVRFDCANRLKMLVLAMHSYHDVYGTLPPAVVFDKNGNPMHSWRALILPYLVEKDVYEGYNFDEPWNSPGNLAVAEKLKDGTFFCSSLGSYSLFGNRREPDTPLTSYVAVTGPGTAFDGDSKTRLNDITDGKSHTILLVEFVSSDIQILEPRDITAEEFIAAFERSGRLSAVANQEGGNEIRPALKCELSRHNAGINIGLADGSIRCVSREFNNIGYIPALTTVAGRDVVGGDFN